MPDYLPGLETQAQCDRFLERSHALLDQRHPLTLSVPFYTPSLWQSAMMTLRKQDKKVSVCMELCNGSFGYSYEGVRMKDVVRLRRLDRKYGLDDKWRMSENTLILIRLDPWMLKRERKFLCDLGYKEVSHYPSSRPAWIDGGAVCQVKAKLAELYYGRKAIA